MGASLTSYWRVWTAKVMDRWVLDTIKNGYSMEFIHHPPNSLVRTQWLESREETVLADLYRQTLVKRGHQACSGGRERERFLLPNRSSAKILRPVLDLRSLNNYILNGRFKILNGFIVSSLKLNHTRADMRSLSLCFCYHFAVIHYFVGSFYYLTFALLSCYFPFEML